MNCLSALKMFALVGGVLLLIDGCQTEETYREQRTQKARQDYFRIVTRYVPEGKVYSLPECIDSALKKQPRPGSLRSARTGQQRT
jgi:hypothetical protein